MPTLKPFLLPDSHKKLLHPEEFISLKYQKEKDDIEYHGKNKQQIESALKRKYYAERCFNLMREMKDGFKNFDRDEKRAGTATIEITDLYKDETMFAVKIGKTSAKLCYVVDQSLTSLRMYRHGTLKDLPEIKTVAVWLILERKKHLGQLPDGKINIDELDMLMLKNRLDQWKKEVRLAGFVPCIHVNYKTF